MIFTGGHRMKSCPYQKTFVMKKPCICLFYTSISFFIQFHLFQRHCILLPRPPTPVYIASCACSIAGPGVGTAHSLLTSFICPCLMCDVCVRVCERRPTSSIDEVPSRCCCNSYCSTISVTAAKPSLLDSYSSQKYGTDRSAHDLCYKIIR